LCDSVYWPRQKALVIDAPNYTTNGILSQTKSGIIPEPPNPKQSRYYTLTQMLQLARCNPLHIYSKENQKNLNQRLWVTVTLDHKTSNYAFSLAGGEIICGRPEPVTTEKEPATCRPNSHYHTIPLMVCQPPVPQNANTLPTHWPYPTL
jgi:hypothetical protein